LVFDNGGLTNTAGVISGSGSVTVLGLADLTADNTYTGGTTIAASGVLFLGSTSTTGSVVGDITDNGRLGFEHTNNITFGGVISGSGTVELGGPGTLTLTGANSYTGLTSVVNGVLALSGNGSIAQSSRLDVASGAVFDISATTNGAAITTLSGAGGVNLGAEALVLTQAADTFSGSIAGTSGVIIEAGTETLTGVNTYTGGTLIAGGTLKGSASSFGGGGIEVDGALVIDQSVGGVFANTIVGAGSFTKAGGGALNLTGMDGFTGATTVSAGLLSVNGYLGGSVVTVQSGAALGGDGVVGGVIAQAGANVAPGNSIGLLTVNGNYSQAAGSIYQVQLTSTGASDRINVIGQAAIAAGAEINVTKLDANPYVIGTQYTVMNATGGVTGSFDLTGDIKVTDFLGLAVSEDADNVYLDVTKTKTFAQAGGTSNQIATGGALDTLPTTGPLVAAVSNLQTDAQAQAAFDQLSGEAHASVKTALLEDGQLVRDAETSRLRSVFDETAADAGDAGLWGQAFDNRGSNDGDGNAAKINRSTSGLLFGGDTAALKDWRTGFLAGFGHTDLKVGARQSSGGSDDYHLGVYAGTQQGPWGVKLGADYSLHHVSMDRSVGFTGFTDRLTSTYNSGLAQAFADVGYRIPLARGTVEPFGSLAFESLHTDGFDEHGGAAALKASGDSNATALSTLGVRGAERFKQGDTQFTLRASLGWRHAYGDVTPSSTAAFAGGANFTVQGTPLAKDSLSVGLGLDVVAAHNLTVGVSYAGQLSSQAQDNAAKANVSWRF
jgi:fibronectin-binding autotransporter adhesin